jgi:hypothetical protein
MLAPKRTNRVISILRTKNETTKDLDEDIESSSYIFRSELYILTFFYTKTQQASS